MYWVEANWGGVGSDPSNLLSAPLSETQPEELLPTLFVALYAEDITPAELEQLVVPDLRASDVDGDERGAEGREDAPVSVR